MESPSQTPVGTFIANLTFVAVIMLVNCQAFKFVDVWVLVTHTHSSGDIRTDLNTWCLDTAAS